MKRKQIQDGVVVAAVLKMGIHGLSMGATEQLRVLG